MDKTARFFGFLLIVVGVAGYLHTEKESPTALIPAGLGLLIFIMGFLGKQESRRKLTMHVAVLVALVGAGASAPRFFKALTPPEGQEMALSTYYMGASFGLCVLFVLLGIGSFMKARKD